MNRNLIILFLCLAYLCSCSQSTSSSPTQTSSISTVEHPTKTLVITLNDDDHVRLTPTPTSESKPEVTPTPEAGVNLDSLDNGIYAVFWQNGKFQIRISSNEITPLSLPFDINIPPATSPGSRGWFDISPDRNWLAFMDCPREKEGLSLDCGKEGLFLYNLKTENLQQIPMRVTSTGEAFYTPFHFRFSPNSQWLIFAACAPERGRLSSLYRLKVEDLSIEFIIDWPEDDYVDNNSFSWSSDGSLIAFTPIRPFDDAPDKIMIVDVACLDNLNCFDTYRFLGSGNSPGWDPKWSPANLNIAFICKNQGQKDICITDIEGNLLNIIGNRISSEYEFTWSPDGSYIAYVSGYPFQEYSVLYVAPAFGGKAYQLSEQPVHDDIRHISWSPDGEYIAYNLVSLPQVDVYLIPWSGGEAVKISDSDYSCFATWIEIPGSINVGSVYEITLAGNGLKLRESPSPDGDIVQSMKYGDKVTILEGPVESGGFTWFKMRHEETKKVGWGKGLYAWLKLDQP